ncbi:hypothetical protein COJ85_01310 [Bacillus sp. AFS076308]|uniref:hypothetical protein n=1 Tax=unclassified Bacillus (in: firmicutes) TaxID=185979 RepID=UPI000BF7DFC5|nr:MULTISPECIES: hypothetical protein [unclassified Bacillus (in: firmicutes)]PFO09618.1 hypothetical protein COJ85_01310 [Bacillus sp. AFS076308]PGV54784.1 hypothetical protein COD92_03480 [Bacillus sp. AFS037270]
MDQVKQRTFSVEYELGGVTFYKNVNAASMEDAKNQVQAQQTNASIRAVSIIEENENYAG